MPNAIAAATAAPLTYRVEEIARLLGLSRAAAYDAVARGEIPSLRFGRRVVVPRAAFDRMLGQQSNPNAERK